MNAINQLPTERQQEILNFIADTIADIGVPPTIREIADWFEISSPNGVVCHLKALSKKGYLEWEPYASRSIRLVNPKDCPFCGRRMPRPS